MFKKIVLLLAFSLFLIACRPEAPVTDLNITLSTDPNPALKGEADLIVTVRDQEDNPIENALVRVKGDMNHAGMEPVLGEVIGGNYGIYAIPFEWTMAGDWVVTVEVEMADSTVHEKVFELTVNNP